ncbi:MULTISPECIES: diacylglycerol kinase family protein [unclassified Staphylococcus]|uniref:diacylglycerol kinase family protein n=1 Tax=unclassified Staphylococcus TaxID=91994 RepID=UPI0021D0083E|nr:MULTISPECIES: diacylglycerol kinase family protein [unclassified Staphylococcus]UXR79382.1 diacylglycerol kinase family protein [Staphylococcus sp. IVB6227]UXR83517.1 diacylglycerol kinase family protein [Staphylococcus sp. IVB6214]
MARFKHAFEGGWTLLTKDRNFFLHVVAGGMAIVLGIMCHISKLEWLFVIIAIALVWLTEALNTAIEYTVDLVTKDYHIDAKRAKDIGAFSVLLACILAVIIGLIIFVPKLL